MISSQTLSGRVTLGNDCRNLTHDAGVDEADRAMGESQVLVINYRPYFDDSGWF